MPRKTRDQRVEARRKRIEARGFKRAAARDVRKEERTERLAARKGLTTDQASRLQENRRQRFREFAAGGTENITTGRLRFSSDPSGESNPAGQAGAMDVERNQANATLARQAQATAADRASMLDGVVARDYRRSPPTNR